MNLVIFYKKRACVTNNKQKELLRKAGCLVIERNILSNTLTKEELSIFFRDEPIDRWFNKNAPRIKNGLLNISDIDKDEALNMMIEDPILIKRPLLIINNEKICGFNQDKIEDLLNTKLK